MDEIQVERTVVDGVERVVYRPAAPRFDTPILMAHGMWHAAWCWEPWQRLFAEWGWESTAFSLPSHGGSEKGRPIRWCTLSYYSKCLTNEIARFDRPPVVFAHSLGGALLLEHVKRSGREIRAGVFVASVPHDGSLKTFLRFLCHDPWGTFQVISLLTAAPIVRSAASVQRAFLRQGASLSADELRDRLDPESMLPTIQLYRIWWSPPKALPFPNLWVSCGGDFFFSVKQAQQSASRFDGTHITFRDAAHDLMLDPESTNAAEKVREWLEERGL